MQEVAESKTFLICGIKIRRGEKSIMTTANRENRKLSRTQYLEILVKVILIFLCRVAVPRHRYYEFLKRVCCLVQMLLIKMILFCKLYSQIWMKKIEYLVFKNFGKLQL
ncbi:hypothetical protein [Lactovum miscens]|uniref:Uncharacterized protein n=1 Tax=Lactovum miscens TaxID=190387 RepID=A0A841C515_9LACT|nr:hypothetical protein [Lactovum miscens]MBB5887893.1 hypothetical protein [Lactovum miscens]